MHPPLPYVPYKRIRLRNKRFINWRKVALTVMALVVIFSMIVMEILALLPTTP